MRFIGIDQSLTSTGVVIIEKDQTIFVEQYVFPSEDNFKHLYSMTEVFDDLYRSFGAKAIGFEGYSFASKGNTLTRLVELGTMIRFVAAKYTNTSTYIFAPQNLKKFVAGKIFKKDEMRLEVFKRWAFENKSNDIVDAYAIARYTQAIYSHLNNKEQKLTSFQAQAIEAWSKNKNGLYVNEKQSGTNG